MEGDVIITKCPCMHPGDVRRLRAVDVPQLRHIRDCVVFPSRGKAPHPFEMSGSDLDGDEYGCIWMEELIFEHNAMPYVYDDKPFGVNPFKVQRRLELLDTHKHNTTHKNTHQHTQIDREKERNFS